MSTENDEPTDNNIVKIIRCFVEPIQDREDLMQTIINGVLIENAEGVQLDMIGKFVGQGRNGQIDVVYRRFITARIETNKSNGLIDQLLSISRLVLGVGIGTLYFDNIGAAGFMIRVDAVALPYETRDVLLDFLNAARAAGVRCIVESSAEDPSTWMRWDVDNWDTKVMVEARDRGGLDV